MANRFQSLAYAGRFVGVVAILTSFAFQAASTPSAAAFAMPSDANSNKNLLAAAEPFGRLTVISFSAAWPIIDQTISEAEAAAIGVRGSLTRDATGQLDKRIAAIKSARQKHDRAKLALTSIETFRVLVSAVTDNAKIPTEVSLLDYAGFRYDANLKTNR